MAYITGQEIKAELQTGMVSTSEFDDLYDTLAATVSTSIDRYCFRTFEVPTEATARTYRPVRTLCEVDELDDIADTTDLAVSLDSSDSGTYTVSTAWYAETDNRTGMVTAIRSTGLFPSSCIRPRTIQVTAWFGWPATPDPVKRAALLWALRLVNRRQTPAGVMGFGEFGGIRLGTIDPDVKSLLAPYRLRARLLR